MYSENQVKWKPYYMDKWLIRAIVINEEIYKPYDIEIDNLGILCGLEE